MTDDELRAKYRPGVPCWVDTAQPDVDAGVAFYSAVFGWAYEERPVPGPDRYLVARKDGLVVGGLGRAAAEDPERARWTSYVTVEDADAAVARVTAEGGHVRAGPVDAGPAGRSAVFVDPTGAELGLWQPGARIGVERVNEDASWNWSDLVTTDVGVARRFYEAVFPWEARPAAIDGLEATMWCVPGYGDALAELDPTISERHATDGIPPGFSDAIGWLEASDDGTSRWRVTFAADDPDAIAERSEAHGGRVVVPPQDVGPVRQATLADPAGATFVVSRYQP